MAPASTAPPTFEQTVVFPVTRLIFLFAAIVTVFTSIFFVGAAFYKAFENPDPGVVRVLPGEVTPSRGGGMGNRQPSSGEKSGGGGASLPSIFAETKVDALVSLFTAAGLPNDGVRAVLTQLTLEAVEAGDEAKDYIDNAIAAISLVPKDKREQSLNTYHSIRLKRVQSNKEAALIRAGALAQQKTQALTLAGVSVIVFIQSALVLCLLAIERNGRRWQG